MSEQSQFEPNTTQIPNIIFDYWMPIISSIELSILLIVCRKTFGWHKRSDKISMTQLIEMTGFKETAIREAVNSLVKRNLLKRTYNKKVKGNFSPNTYEINLSALEKNKKSPVKSPAARPTLPRFMGHTKETLTKEKTTTQREKKSTVVKASDESCCCSSEISSLKKKAEEVGVNPNLLIKHSKKFTSQQLNQALACCEEFEGAKSLDAVFTSALKEGWTPSNKRKNQEKEQLIAKAKQIVSDCELSAKFTKTSVTFVGQKPIMYNDPEFRERFNEYMKNQKKQIKR